MWKKAYELIVNCNVMIDKCRENSNPLLPAPYFGIVKVRGAGTPRDAAFRHASFVRSGLV